jgi:transposase
MILTTIPAERIFICLGFTDLRRSIDGLSVLVQQVFKHDPFTNSLYIFCGRRRDRIKALYWEKDGFMLLYKRLESGSKYNWPRNKSELQQITAQQLRWLLEGLAIEQRSAIPLMPSVQIT